MGFAMMKRWGLAAGCALLLGAAAAPSAALADVTWYISGAFDDGGTFSGYFIIDQYGFITGDPGSFDIQTTIGSVDGALGYVAGASGHNETGGGTILDLSNGNVGQGDVNFLHLKFGADFGVSAPEDPIITLDHASFECQGSTGCYNGGGANLRYVVSSTVTTTQPGVPEPAGWALMTVGFGGLGAMLRRRRTLAAAA